MILIFISYINETSLQLMINTNDYTISIYIWLDGNKVTNDYHNTELTLDDNNTLLVKELIKNKNYNLALIDINIQQLFIDNCILVLKSINELEKFLPYHIDIETSTGCNFSCKFCPQHISPKKNSVMPMDMFKTIVDKLDDYHINFFVFQHYNEPLMDPYFFERLDYITSKNYKLFLYTNAMYLSEEVTNKLNEYELYGMCINFASTDAEEWAHLTSRIQTQQINVINNIKYFANNYKHKMQEFQLSVNGNNESIYDKSTSIREYFSDLDIVPMIFNCWSHSRAGSIENEYVVVKAKRTEQHFTGCSRGNNYLHISYKGEVFLCCQDYHQKVIFGNLLTHSVEEIYKGELAKKHRGMLYGVYPMDDNAICRNCLWLR